MCIFNGRKQTLVNTIGILSALGMRGLHDKRHLLAKLRIAGSENCNSGQEQNTLKQRAQTVKTHAGAWRLKQFYKHPKFQFTHKLINSCHNLTKSTFLAMLHRQCKVNGICKVAIFYVVNGAVLELQFAHKSYVCNYIAILSAQKC